jgi:hypothetical protein
MPKYVRMVVRSKAPARPWAGFRPVGALVRPILLALVGLVLAMALSGCAAALRVLTVVDGVYTVANFFGSMTSTDGSESTTSDGTSADWVAASVVDTEGGLWLNAGPGTDPPFVVAEGTQVWLYCYVDGPYVDGPYGTTSIWNFTSTPSGHTGFMSDAYLATGSNDPVVPECTFE